MHGSLLTCDKTTGISVLVQLDKIREQDLLTGFVFAHTVFVHTEVEAIGSREEQMLMIVHIHLEYTRDSSAAKEAPGGKQ